MILIRSVTSADGAIVTGQIRIRKLIFVAAAAADSVTLKDGKGVTTVVLNGGAATSSQSCDFGDEGLFLPSGHQVTAITAGDTLYIYGM
jgi:hypothetical protein